MHASCQRHFLVCVLAPWQSSLNPCWRHLPAACLLPGFLFAYRLHRLQKYRGMGSLEAMAKGSEARYLSDTQNLKIAQVGCVEW